MAKRGRVPGFQMSNEHRTKIGNSQILKCLLEHVEGRREMSATQVSAGLGLLRKVLPDLQALAETGDNGALKPLNRMTDDELEVIAAGGSSGVAAPPKSSRQLN
jgi:hypothetical protein